MNPGDLYSALDSAHEKPRVFSAYTARELWTDKHTSKSMLAFHLDSEIDVSSRRMSFIDKSVRWLAEEFSLSVGSRVLDFGCGPGLYTSRIARLGAEAVGIDFSSRSIAYAREYARDQNLEIRYLEADYLDYEPDGRFQLILMIMCDFCALSPAQRSVMLEKFERLLATNGRVVLDVYSLRAFADKEEGVVCEKNQLDGFWSDNPYFGIVGSFKYEDEKVSLDKYTIVEERRQREVFNWLQYFTPESLELEAQAAGLHVQEVYGDVAGSPYDVDATEFAVVLKRL